MSKHKWAPSMLTLYSDTRGIWFNVRDDDTFQPFLIHTRTSPTYTRAHRKYWLDWMLKNTHKHTHTPLALCIAAAGNRDKTEPSARARGGKKRKTSTGGFHGNCLPFSSGGGKATSGWLRLTFKVARGQGGKEFKVVWSMNPSGFFTSRMRRVIYGNGGAARAAWANTLGCTVSMLSSRTHTDWHIHTRIIYIYITDLFIILLQRGRMMSLYQYHTDQIIVKIIGLMVGVGGCVTL